MTYLPMYNKDMENRFFKLHRVYRTLSKLEEDSERRLFLIGKFKYMYYPILKRNDMYKKMMQEGEQDGILVGKYIEPTLKARTDNDARLLGLTPYDELSEEEKEKISVDYHETYSET